MATAAPEAPAADDTAMQAFTVTLIVRRFNPEQDAEPYWEDFDVEMYSTDRVLDALHKIKWDQDGTLAFRRSLRSYHLAHPDRQCSINGAQPFSPARPSSKDRRTSNECPDLTSRRSRGLLLRRTASSSTWSRS